MIVKHFCKNIDIDINNTEKVGCLWKPDFLKSSNSHELYCLVKMFVLWMRGVM